MKSLLTVTALMEVGAGLALLGFPAASVRLLAGELLEAPAFITVARIGGAGLLSLGIASWFARSGSWNRAARGLIAAILLYNVAAVAILAEAILGFGLHGVLLWPGVVVHASMTAWCILSLAQSTERTAGS
jgi:hypothetical protein